MARELSREIGIDKDPSAGDDDSFFHSPFSFKPFRHGFEEMSCESELEDINQTNTEDNTLGYDIENGMVTTDDCDYPLMPDDLNHAFLNECHLQLEDLQLAQELDTEADTNKDQSKIYIPELKAYKYKSQVVSELVNNGKVSSDRLTRVRQGASSSGSNSSSTGVECNDKYSVGLFNFLAVRSDDDKGFFLGRVIRIMRRYQTTSGRKRKIDYVRPVNIKTIDADVLFRVNVLQKAENIYKLTDEIVEVPLSNVLFAVESYKDGDGNYVLNAVDVMSLETYFERPNGPQDISDSGRRTVISMSSRGRLRRNVTFTH